MRKINSEQIFLGMGITAWIIYLLNLFVLAALTPWYSHMRHQVSDLGRLQAPHHQIFNSVIILIGLLYLPTGLGFFYAVKRITGKKLLAVLIGISVALISVGAFFAGFYPLPDPLHNGYNIMIIQLFIPLLLVWAFWKVPGTRFFVFYQLTLFALMLILNRTMTGAFGLVNEMNIGLIQRLFVLSGMFWFTFTCYWLIRYKSKKFA